ncbi:MAG: glycosyltransferase family protein [Peptococcaceae bacterium]|nr:glycosyltransferase family protein [Peptococcaceae bacterium]
MKKVIIVQARMSSTRLPGKVLKEVLGKPLLEYQYERLQRVRLADKIVIATTVNQSDQPVIDFCKRLNISYYRGSETDVLTRYYEAALLYSADIVVRVTSDCPLIDPFVIDKVMDFYLQHYPTYDYVSNTLERTYPRGMDTEVFSFKALERAHFEAVSPPDREHVTPFLYRNSEKFRINNVSFHSDQSCHRWTVDTVEDFELIKRVLECLYPINPEFTMEDVLDIISLNPDWFYINAHVEQKKYGQ